MLSGYREQAHGYRDELSERRDGAGTVHFGSAANPYTVKKTIFALVFQLVTARMDWVILIIAGCFESGFAFCLGKMKEVTGAAYWLWGAGFLLCLALSMLLLAKAVKTLPIGTAYPVWTGIGAVGTVILGIVFFHESASFLRLFFIATLIASIVGLKLVS